MQSVFFAHNIYPLFPYTLAQTFGSYEETEKNSVRCLYFRALKFAYYVSKKTVLQNFAKEKKEKTKKNSHLNVKIYRCFMSNRLK